MSSPSRASRNDQAQPGRRTGQRLSSGALPLNWPTVRSALIGFAIGVAVFILLSGTIVLSLYGYFQMSDRILLGVQVSGIRLSNRTVDEAIEILESEWQSDDLLTVRAGEGTDAILFAASPADLGLSLSTEPTASRALAVGRGESAISEIGTLLDATFTGFPVAPLLAIDEPTARVQLEAWAESVFLPPQNATIRLEGAGVQAVRGVNGAAVDVEATLSALNADPGAVVAQGDLPLVMVSVPPAITDASNALDEAERLLAAPAIIDIYDPITDESQTWTAAPETIASWLMVEAGDGGTTVAVDTNQIGAYVSSQSKSLGSGRSIDIEAGAQALVNALEGGRTPTLIVQHAPTSYTVQSGDTLISIAWKAGMPWWRIAEDNPGINIDALDAGQTLTIPSKNDLLPLPVVPGKRLRVDISDQRLYAYEDGTQISEHVISTGIDRSPTQPGIFQVQTHDLNAYASLWDLTMPHFIGIYEAWPGFMNGFHGLPTLSGGRILWADILGRPASYGCIILDLDEAEWLYTWAEAGVVVEITE